MKIFGLIVFLGMLNFSSPILCAQNDASAAIQNAAAENKSLFIFFYKEGNEKTKIFKKHLMKACRSLESRLSR